MFETCRSCGRFAQGDLIPVDGGLRCPACGSVAKFRRLPLFFLSGASCSGKSTAAHILFDGHHEYMTMECDILWGPHFNTPEDDYAAFRDTWLRMAANYAQHGKSSLLCGCITPEQIDRRSRKTYFSSCHYIAIVLSDEEMLRRLEKRGADEANRVSSLDFNRWLRENGEAAGMTVLDATSLTPHETAQRVHEWVMNILAGKCI